MLNLQKPNHVIKSLRQLLARKISELSTDNHTLSQKRIWVSSVTWSLIIASTGAVAWLYIARTEEIIVVTGKLQPLGSVQEVKLPVGGVVKEIYVKDGERVKKDDVLISLDAKAVKKQVESLRSRLADKNLQLIKTLDLSEQEILTTQAQLELTEIILSKLQTLQTQGATSELQYLEQKTKAENLRGQLKKIRIDSVRQKSILNQEIQDLSSQLTASEVSYKYQTLRAPLDGIIFDLQPTTPGFVVQTTEPILKIVPQNDLQAAVEIPSDKIGFVKVGMTADLSIDSFPATDFGVIEGSLASIGSDALPPDPSEQREKYSFPATITLKSQFLKVREGFNLPLQAGMSLTANIKLRSVSYLQLLLNTFQGKVDSLRTR